MAHQAAKLVRSEHADRRFESAHGRSPSLHLITPCWTQYPPVKMMYNCRFMNKRSETIEVKKRKFCSTLSCCIVCFFLEKPISDLVPSKIDVTMVIYWNFDWTVTCLFLARDYLALDWTKRLADDDFRMVLPTRNKPMIVKLRLFRHIAELSAFLVIRDFPCDVKKYARQNWAMGVCVCV